MEKLDLFSYSNPKQFLLDSLALKQRVSKGFSVRGWSREMGQSSHVLLTMLLQGKRPLRVKHAAFLSQGLNLSAHERLYFQALIQFDSASGPEEKSLCALWLSELHPGREFKIKEMESFIAISNWIYTAILAMTDLKNFEFSDNEIARRLGKKATLSEVRAAIERLTSLGLLERTAEGKMKATFQKVTTKNDIKDAGVRKYHQAASDLAKVAVETIDPELREFQSSSMAIDSTKLPLAKEMIRKFRAQFAKAVGGESADQIYQMNIQFFQLTESPVIQTEDEGVDTEKHPHAIRSGVQDV